MVKMTKITPLSLDFVPKIKKVYHHKHFQGFLDKYPKDQMFLVMPLYKKLYPEMEKVAAVRECEEVINNPDYICL